MQAQVKKMKSSQVLFGVGNTTTVLISEPCTLNLGTKPRAICSEKPNLQFVEFVHQALQISAHHGSAGEACTQVLGEYVQLLTCTYKLKN